MDVEVAIKPEGSLPRVCYLQESGRRIVTPTRALSVTRSQELELDAIRHQIGGKFAPLGEVFARVSIGTLSRIREDDSFGMRLQSAISRRLRSLNEAGALPYLVLQLVDDENKPYGKLPPKIALDLLFNLLWGSEPNRLLVPPLLGALRDPKEYSQLVSVLQKHVSGRTGRTEPPLVALVPLSYRLVDPKLVERYWKAGCRVFAFDCENKRFGSFGYIVERLHNQLDALAKQSHEPYILHALNAKQRTGRAESMRVNDLLSPGFGFDSFGPNHGGRHRWVPPKSAPEPPRYFLDRETYGFVEAKDLLGRDNPDALGGLESKAVHGFLQKHRRPTGQLIRELSIAHNVEVEIGELREFPGLIETGEMMHHFEGKERIQQEVDQMRKLARKTLLEERQKGLEEWFT